MSDALSWYLQNTNIQRQRQIFFAFWLEINQQHKRKLKDRMQMWWMKLFVNDWDQNDNIWYESATEKVWGEI